MQAHEIRELLQQQNGRAYQEFLRVPAMSMGLYVLRAGDADRQQPHNEDEVYYILSGRGFIHVAGEERAVQAGSIVYVRAHDAHRFHSISEDLHILVFFAPAES
ncbi:MAG: cupin domain-containing protein [Chloroflexi bacterium]|nr:cupin domain-containing protein [Chloroflexota bacterium]